MFEDYYGKRVTGIRAFGHDKFDYIESWAIELSFSVGDGGYFCLEFGKASIYITTSGLTECLPAQTDTHELSIGKQIRDYFQGKKLFSIAQKDGEYIITFTVGSPIVCYYSETLGWTSRNYMEVEQLKPFFIPCDDLEELQPCKNCGGSGTMGLDMVQDYSVECSACRRSTRAYINRDDALKAWSRGDLPCHADLTLDELTLYLKSGIFSIEIAKDGAEEISLPSCAFESAVIKTQEGYVSVKHRDTGDKHGAALFETVYGFEWSDYPYRIQTTKEKTIAFVKYIFAEDGGLEGIAFRYGAGCLFLHIATRCLILSESSVNTDPKE